MTEYYKNDLVNILPHNSFGAEIGVWKGEFSQLIFEHINPKMLYLVDPWKFIKEHEGSWHGGGIAMNQEDMDKIYSNVYDMFKEKNNVHILRIFSNELESFIKPNCLDWTYIDGNHRYEAVLNDLNTSFNLVKKGGLITGDDFEMNNDIDLALTEFLRDNNKVELISKSNRTRQFVIKIL